MFMGIWGFKGGVITCYYYDRLRFLGRALVIDCYNSIPWQRIVHLIAQKTQFEDVMFTGVLACHAEITLCLVLSLLSLLLVYAMLKR
jgi:hypothetical protein